MTSPFSPPDGLGRPDSLRPCSALMGNALYSPSLTQGGPLLRSAIRTRAAHSAKFCSANQHVVRYATGGRIRRLSYSRSAHTRSFLPRGCQCRHPLVSQAPPHFVPLNGSRHSRGRLALRFPDSPRCAGPFESLPHFIADAGPLRAFAFYHLGAPPPIRACSPRLAPQLASSDWTAARALLLWTASWSRHAIASLPFALGFTFLATPGSLALRSLALSASFSCTQWLINPFSRASSE